ncbi:MAG: efflux transporter, family, subunit, partial [Bacteroidota bacterium]|nr:efflux transporter, family, subunit [Bacteroidota bacterium]
MSKAIWVVVAVVLLVGGIIVYNKVLYPKDKGPAGPAAGGIKELTVNAFIVKPKALNNDIVASGSLLANEQISIQSEISAKIVQLNLVEGTVVTKGALMVKLYDEDLQAQLKKSQAQEETAIKTEQRVKQLLAVNGVGQQDYDNAVTALKGIQADIDFIKAQISKTEIRAPFNGMVGLRNVSLGAYVSPAMVIATLQQVDPLKIDLTVPEKYSAMVNMGDDITLTVDEIGRA